MTTKKKALPDLSCIAESLRHLAIPISDLKPDPENARSHDQKNIDAIVGSLRAFGQQKPIVVRRETMTIVAGNGTLAAAKALGWKHIAANVEDMDSATAAGFALADNRSAELADWNTDALEKLLGELPEGTDELLDAMLSDLAAEQAIVDGKQTELKQLETKPPPKMAWVLIGIPTVRFGEVADDVERISSLPEVICETTANDGTSKELRPSAARRGYDHKWRVFRANYLKAHPLCVRQGCREPANEIDHEPPLDGPNDPGRLDPARCAGLCKSHHSEKTAKQRWAGSENGQQ